MYNLSFLCRREITSSYSDVKNSAEGNNETSNKFLELLI